MYRVSVLWTSKLNIPKGMTVSTERGSHRARTPKNDIASLETNYRSSVFLNLGNKVIIATARVARQF